MLKQYNLMLPRAVYGGENSIDKLTEIITNVGAKKVALFTDKGIQATGLLDLPLKAILASGANCLIYDDLPVEPNYFQVQKIIDQFKSDDADFIVACGGGSVMDTSKLASVLVTDKYGVKDLLDKPNLAKKCVPVVMIPTTAGTGAEVTPNAIVSVPEKKLKIGIVNSDMIADYVILDARMIQKLPRHIAAATGLDAFCHCIECFTSNKSNPFSDIYALEGLDLIINHLKPACDDPNTLDDKKAMQIAAFYGGLAITSSGTTAVHALSYPLGGKYHIPHGISNAILLPSIMRFNSKETAVQERLALVYDRCNNDKSNYQNNEDKADWIIKWIENIVQHLNIPTSLKNYNVPLEDLEELVESGMNVQRLLKNNMRPVNANDVRKIYKDLL